MKVWPFSESVLENKTTFVKQRRSAFWKYRSLYDNVVVTLSQNHIEHDTLYFLNSIDLLLKGMFETKDHTWIKINVPARPQTRKILKKKHSLGNFTTKKLLSIFRLPLNIWRKCLSESRKHICKQVIVSGTLRRTKQLSEKVSRSQNHLENDIFILKINLSFD